MKSETFSHEEWAAEVLRVGNRAVREAQARNRALGIPNWYLVGGRLVSDAATGERAEERASDDGTTRS